MTYSYKKVINDNLFSQKIAEIKFQIEEIDKQVEQIKLYGSLLPINQVLLGDCCEVLKTLPDDSIDCVVTDPPYSLGKVKNITKLITAWLSGEDGTEHHSNGFMDKDWDIIPSPKTWREVYRVLKPGGYALVFAGTRTVDLMGLSLRLAGFELQDLMAHLQGQGFPKGKTQLKPALEPIIMAYKRGKRVLNVDECRIGVDASDQNLRFNEVNHKGDPTLFRGGLKNPITYPHSAPSSGRYPSNVILSHHADCVACGTKKIKTQWGQATRHEGDCLGGKIYEKGLFNKELKTIGYTDSSGTEEILAYECVEDCPVKLLDKMSGSRKNGGQNKGMKLRKDGTNYVGEIGAASRFFLNLSPELPFIYQSKASQNDRTCNGKIDNTHVTVKPTNLIAYLVRLICPENGVVLDPFIGSGTTALACIKENKNYIGIEREEEYHNLALERIKHYSP